MGTYERTVHRTIEESETVEFCNSCGIVEEGLRHVIVDAKVEKNKSIHGKLWIQDGDIIDGYFSGGIDAKTFKQVADATHLGREYPVGVLGSKAFRRVEGTSLTESVTGEEISWTQVVDGTLDYTEEANYKCRREAHICDRCIELIFDCEEPKI